MMNWWDIVQLLLPLFIVGFCVISIILMIVYKIVRAALRWLREESPE